MGKSDDYENTYWLDQEFPFPRFRTSKWFFPARIGSIFAIQRRHRWTFPECSRNPSKHRGVLSRHPILREKCGPQWRRLGWSGSFPCDGYFLVGHSLCHPMSSYVLYCPITFLHSHSRKVLFFSSHFHPLPGRCLETSHCFIRWHPRWADGTGDDLPQGLPQMWPGKHANGMSPKIMRYLLTAVFVGIGIECHCSPIFYCSRPFWKFWNMLNGGRRLRCMGQSWKSEIESHKACLKFWEHPNN